MFRDWEFVIFHHLPPYNKDGTFKVDAYNVSGALLKNSDGELELKWRVGDSENEQIGRYLLVPHSGTSGTRLINYNPSPSKIQNKNPK